MSGTPYSYGGYSVTVAGDGAIRVKSGDMLSHYSMAIYHDFNSMDTRFGRKVGGAVKSFADIPADINRIVAGETLYDMKTHRGGGGASPPPPPATGKKQQALAHIDQFDKRSGPTAFNQFNRQKVAEQLRVRVNDPTVIEQNGAGVCGPTAFLFSLAQDDPLAYAKLVTDLYEHGAARTGRLDVRPANWFVRYTPSASPPPEADWIGEGSLRNSEDWFNLYSLLGKRSEWCGPSTPWAIARWFKDAGYTQSEWGGLDMPSLDTRLMWMKILGNMVAQGWRVVLLINHDLESKSPAWSSRLSPDHYVGMTARPAFTPAGDPGDVGDDLMSLTIFSNGLQYDVGRNHRGWAGNVRVPVPRLQPLTVGEVMRYVWSYAAGRY